YDFDPEIKFAWGLQLEQRKHGLAPGTTFTLKSYDPSIKVDGPFELAVNVVGKEPITLPDGKSRTLTKVNSTMQLQGVAITTASWVDDDANPLVMDFNMGGFSVRVLAATKEQALAGGNEAAPEMFINTFVKVDRRIGPDAKVVKLRLKLPPDDKSNMKMPDLPNTPAQSVEKVNDHEAIVTIRRLDWAAIRKAGDTAATDPAMKEYLRASPTVDINDKRIKRHAKRAVKDARTPAEKADALRRYVTEFVEYKALDVGFASASEVVRTRKGDCSEHAVLLAAMARAAGLPARGVSGIVQIPPGSLAPGEGGSFGYHMWTQVNIDGQWVDIDAALRQTDCDATHVALALMPLNDEGLGGSIISMLPLLGRLQMEIISVEPPQAAGARP
ncbi:MAG TPA: transglutaminase-like domain-containing protein, partial [Phycisphaerae bacterium]|nr:transglutaminase-like domain-containing protein [Phycisphaerae bacterium]